MRRFVFVISIFVLGALAASCGNVGGPTASAPLLPPLRSASADLSPNNYIEEFQTATTPAYIALGSDKNMWFTTTDSVAQITENGTTAYFLNPDTGGLPTHIAAGRPGSV